MEDLQKDYKLEATYSQTDDCSSSSDEGYQFLRIFTENGGGGDFFILETKRWAFDDPQELLDIINEFVEKHGRIQAKKKKS